MFDKKSDYALNKQDPEAIVCRNVNDGPIRLTREDFDIIPIGNSRLSRCRFRFTSCQRTSAGGGSFFFVHCLVASIPIPASLIAFNFSNSRA